MAHKELILALALVLLVACAAPMSDTGLPDEAVAPATDAGEATAAVTSTVENSSDAAAPDDSPSSAVAAFAATMLTFAGDGDTFLEAIDAVRAELDGIESHRYVELTDAAGMVWQGEALQTAGETVVLLQPVGSGGGVGVQLRGPAGADWRPALESVELTKGDGVMRPDPEIRNVDALQTGDGLWSFNVTLAYPDTGWEDYADGWHVATPDGEILATRILLHPHVNEQPFTRGQGNVSVPADVDTVIVRAHTLVRGYSDATVEVPLE